MKQQKESVKMHEIYTFYYYQLVFLLKNWREEQLQKMQKRQVISSRAAKRSDRKAAFFVVRLYQLKRMKIFEVVQ